MGKTEKAPEALTIITGVNEVLYLDPNNVNFWGTRLTVLGGPDPNSIRLTPLMLRKLSDAALRFADAAEAKAAAPAQPEGAGRRAPDWLRGSIKIKEPLECIQALRGGGALLIYANGTPDLLGPEELKGALDEGILRIGPA